VGESPWKFESSWPHQKLLLFNAVPQGLAQFGTKGILYAVLKLRPTVWNLIKFFVFDQH
jgi:hypothetical protein